jgi:hypothetical protein
MGHVHTATRSRLGVEKVRKATMVGMDITRSHMEAGLLRPRARRHLDAFAANNEPEPVANLDAVNSDTDIGSLNGDPEVTANLLNFEKLAAQLVTGSAEDVDSDSEPEEPDGELLPTPATTTSQRCPTASSSTLMAPALVPPAPAPAPTPSLQPQAPRTRTRTRKTRTQIPLKVLFIYPTDLNASLNGMDNFWKGGVKNLENEAEVLEILSTCEEDTRSLQVDEVTVQIDAQTASVDSLYSA